MSELLLVRCLLIVLCFELCLVTNFMYLLHFYIHPYLFSVRSEFRSDNIQRSDLANNRVVASSNNVGRLSTAALYTRVGGRVFDMEIDLRESDNNSNATTTTTTTSSNIAAEDQVVTEATLVENSAITSLNRTVELEYIADDRIRLVR